MKWITCQIGAREHYAIPRVLHGEQKLECLYTDFWAGSIWQQASNFLGNSALSMRFHPDLADAAVKSFDLTTLVNSAFGGKTGNAYDWFLTVGADFGRGVEDSLKRNKKILWNEMIFFGYDTGFLEPARWVKSRGGKNVVCQMDPSRFEVDLVQAEEKNWPGWAKRPLDVPVSFSNRRRQEWAIADLVMVNSRWSQQALIQQGVREEKIVIVPLAYEPSKVRGQRAESRSQESENSGLSSQVSSLSAHPLRVLFLGQVILRKGIQYLIEAAKILENESVRFDVVGPVGISDEALKSAPPNMIFHGSINRNQAPDFFCNADIFVLPTLSDGFALTQIEAMAYGLPVITTPNCGEVVTDGLDGFIVPARDGKALSEAIQAFLKNPENLQRMGAAARKKVCQFSLAKLGENLASLEARLELVP